MTMKLQEEMMCNLIPTSLLFYRLYKPLLLPTTLNAVPTHRPPFANVIVCVGQCSPYSPPPSQMYVKSFLSMANYHNDTHHNEINCFRQLHECSTMWQISFMNDGNL